MVKVSACNVGEPGLIPGSGRCPGEGNGNPLQLLLPGKFHGWKSLVGYSPWHHKESDTTEWLHFHFQNKLFEIKFLDDNWLLVCIFLCNLLPNHITF